MSPTRDAVRAELTRLGEQPVPGPSPAFRARLERQLVATNDAPPARLVALPRRQPRILPALSVAAAAVAVLVSVGLLGGFGNGGPSLQLSTASDTTVVLPGGHTVTGRTGLGLPNGSVVRTGPNGHAAVGTVELGPGGQVVVNAGRLLPLPAAAPNLPPVTRPATARSHAPEHHAAVPAAPPGPHAARPGRPGLGR